MTAESIMDNERKWVFLLKYIRPLMLHAALRCPVYTFRIVGPKELEPLTSRV